MHKIKNGWMQVQDANYFGPQLDNKDYFLVHGYFLHLPACRVAKSYKKRTSQQTRQCLYDPPSGFFFAQVKFQIY